MAIIKSGASSDNWTVDATSKAGRVSDYGTDGRVLTLQSKATYGVSTTPFSPPATPTDMATIYGSGTKTIYVWAVSIAMTQTTAGINRVYLVKRSATNTGGTSAAPTIVPFDSANASATASVVSYTVNASPLGGTVGNICVQNINSPILATGITYGNGSADMYPKTVPFEISQPIVLRGTAQGLAVNFNGAALPAGLSVIVNFIWTEE
jgi:hypothetical protein